MKFFQKLRKTNLFKNYSFFEKHPLAFLNGAQFLAVLNDNIFKLLIVFALIDVKGIALANQILSLAGAIYVAPFLLFSSSAGVLADRFSKQRIILFVKASEILMMILGVIALSFKSAWGAYSVLFLLATHSAVFGPCKYGIIPELVKKDQIVKANGLITGSTYFAIILGTFLASFITQVTGKNFFFAGLFCVAFAVIGFLFALYLIWTPPQGSLKEFNIFFVREIFSTLISIKDRPYLMIAILSSSFFFFLGAFIQLNMIPFAMQALHFPEVGGGYLFLPAAIGIALGALYVDKTSRHRLELSFSLLAGIGMALFLFLIAFSKSHLIFVTLFLILLGICGGIFVVPFDSFIQTFSPPEKRGQVIGATNFLSFLGVLLASFALYLFGDLFQLSAAMGFFCMGIITCIVLFFLIPRLASLFFPFMSRQFSSYFFSLDKSDSAFLERDGSLTLILPNATLFKAFLLLSFYPHIHFYTFSPSKLSILFFNLFSNIHAFPQKSWKENFDLFFEESEKLEEKTIPCLILKGSASHPQEEIVIKKNTYAAEFEEFPKPLSLFRKKTLSLSFSRVET